jgi:hypothetical protein
MIDTNEWERAETAEREVQRLKKESDQILNDAIANIDRKAARIKELEAAIIKTLNENGHLADGEDCTLIDLKRAIPTWELG